MLLVVERNEKFAEKLKSIRIEELRTFIVESGNDACYLLKSADPQFILANLDALDGVDEVETLRKYGRDHHVPVLFIAGFPKTEGLTDLLRSGKQNELIYLPFTLSKLVGRIKRMRAGADALVGQIIGPPGQEMKIVRKLGAGAMGAVYEAIQTALDRRVAVKFLSQDYQRRDTDSAARFANEAKAMARMRSPHIAQVFFVGEHNDLPYLVMEFIDGPDLDAYLKDKGVLSALEALTLCRQALVGLGHAHKNGRIHRDIKPANIMLNRDHQVVILDFGLVRETSGQKLTQTGIVLGTPRYISPEQVNGLPLDHRSDLYSLGVILFEMLLGQPPFKGEDYVAVLMKHVKAPLPRPEELDQSLDPKLYEIVEKFTRKNPSDRYQSAQEAEKAIQDYLEETSQGTLDRRPKSELDVVGELDTVAGDELTRQPTTDSAPTSSRLNVSQMLTYSSEFVPKDVVEELLDIYTEFLGPFARKFAGKQTQTIGMDIEKVPAKEWPTLLNCLSERIEMETKREAFLDRAILLKKKF